MRTKAISVNRACAEKDGAIAFLEFLLSEDYQSQIARKAAYGKMSARPDGFPVRNKQLELFFTYLQEIEELEGLSSFGNFEYQAMPLTEEQIERLREVFFNARPVSAETVNLMPIISEELQSYTVGDKTAEQVLEIIQNRVQLYLYETQ